MFSWGTWDKDDMKLPSEVPQEKGMRHGGQFLFLVRKLRELPDNDPHFKGCSFLRTLPVHGSPPRPGEEPQISPFDKFVFSERKETGT